jgi:site-specific DNA-methyltransferase (adenine-specific)
VDKGDWDKSRGPELNHEFNLEWLKRCQKVLKPNGTIWITGTHHVIFSIGLPFLLPGGEGQDEGGPKHHF